MTQADPCALFDAESVTQLSYSGGAHTRVAAHAH